MNQSSGMRDNSIGTGVESNTKGKVLPSIGNLPVGPSPPANLASLATAPPSVVNQLALLVGGLIQLQSQQLQRQQQTQQQLQQQQLQQLSRLLQTAAAVPASHQNGHQNPSFGNHHQISMGFGQPLLQANGERTTTTNNITNSSSPVNAHGSIVDLLRRLQSPQQQQQQLQNMTALRGLGPAPVSLGSANYPSHQPQQREDINSNNSTLPSSLLGLSPSLLASLGTLAVPSQQQMSHQHMVSQQPVPQRVAPNARDPIPVFTDSDRDHLSEYQCLLRQQIELFEATMDDIQWNSQGRNKAIVLGQVGIRCRHCAQLPIWSRARGAVYYSATLDGLYQAGQNMSKNHLCKHCRRISPDLRGKIMGLRDCKRRAATGKKYWADGARALGIEETSEGLRFRSSVLGRNSLQVSSAQGSS